MLKHLVFIDSRVADFQTLVAGLSADTEWVLLDDDQEGVLQMQAVLADRHQLASIKILAHGHPGALLLGAGELTRDSLEPHAVALAAIGQALDDDGDVQIYGCEVGQGSVGRAFVRALAEALGAHVAASSGVVGHAEMGGEWRLDVGQFSSAQLKLSQWQGLLVYTAVAFSGEFHVNSTLPSDQTYADVAVLADRTIAITWMSLNQDAAGSAGIYTRLFSPDGTPIGPEISVNSTVSNNQMYPAIASLAGGGFVITWQSYLQDGSDWGVFARRFDSTGNPVSNEMAVNTTTIGIQTNPAICPLPDGGFIVSWITSGYDVYARRYAPDGSPSTGEFQANTGAADGVQSGVRAGALTDGSYVLAWMSDTGDGSGQGVYAQKFDAQNHAAGAVFLVNVTTGGNQQNQQVSGLSDGSFVVTWMSSQSGPWDIYARHYSPEGTAIGAEFRVNATTASNQTYPSITGTADGGFAIAWTSENQDSSGNGVYAQRFNSDGSRNGEEFLVNTTFLDSQQYQHIASDPEGGFVVAWQANLQEGGGMGWGIFAKNYSTLVPINGTPGDDPLLLGGAGYDEIHGLGGNDTLDGAGGNDTMFGGLGNDTYYVRQAGDIVTENLNEGTDTAYSYLAAYTLTANVENGRILATGVADLTGNSLNNTLYAGVGNNKLSGGGGTDTVSFAYGVMLGYGGVIANLVTGQATTIGSVTFDTLFGIANLTGSAKDDQLTGNGAANVLNGGIGADQMSGGDGSDSYYVDNTGDTVSETNATASTGGTDTVYSYLTAYTLTPNVENGRILATSVANITGNSLNNVLYAGVGNNVISGGGGIDTVSYAYGVTGTTGVTISLALGIAQATSGSGSDTLIGIANLTGSANGDHLTGNGAANVLNGGIGADQMSGGDGSDYYYVDNTGDTVSETNATASTGGTDTVYSYLTAYTLTPNVENGRIMATVPANITGNSLNNVLYAGVGNNVISGGGGTDTVSFAYGVIGSAGVTASLLTGTAQTTGSLSFDTLIGIANLTGTANADQLTGNGAANVLSGGAGNDTLDGGLGSDTAVYSGQSTGYQFGYSEHKFTISDINRLDGDDGVDVLNNIENIRFADKTLTFNSMDQNISQIFTSIGYFSTFADLSKAAYHLGENEVVTTVAHFGSGDNFVKPYADDAWVRVHQDWHVLTNTEIGMEASGLETSGANVLWAVEVDGMYHGDNAAAFATRCGDSVVISFRGTNDNDADSVPLVLDSKDEQNWADMGGHYHELSPFITKIDAYVAANNITKVYVTGHSLGGGMALGYMDKHDANAHRTANGSTITYEAVTFAAPKYPIIFRGTDNRILAIEVDGDPVPHVAGGTIANINAGNVIRVNVEGITSPTGNPYDTTDFHSMDIYMAASNTLDKELPSTSLVSGNIVHGFDKNLFSFLYGLEVNIKGAETYPVDAEVYSWKSETAPLFSLGQGNDTIGDSGNIGMTDYFLGGPGNDILMANGAPNYLFGGDGVDTVSYGVLFVGMTSGVTVNLGIATAQPTGGSGSDTLISIENLIGTIFVDNLTGNSGPNTLNGGGGNDVLNGMGGADILIGGDDSDTYYVDNIGDTVTETNASISTGGTDLVKSYLSTYTLTPNVENGRILASGTASLTGNTLDNVLDAGAGNNVLDGGAGMDTASYRYAGSGVTVSLAVTTAQPTLGSGADTLIGIENLTGSAYVDHLIGDGGRNIIDGGAGIDVMTGGDGSDTYYVRDVGDIVTETNATVSTGGTDLVYSYLSTYTLTPNVENGRILATGTAELFGNTGNNVLYAGVGDNVLVGGAGTDTVSYAYGVSGTIGVTRSLSITAAQSIGGSGSDTLTSFENLTGSNYNDTLTGNSGANILTGGLGWDILKGNGGNDIFDFNSLSDSGLSSTTRDVISDFNSGDRIDLSTIDANTTTTSVNEAFTGFIASLMAFSAAGQLRLDGNILYGNTDADSTAEFSIQLTGISSLTTADLFL